MILKEWQKQVCACMSMEHVILACARMMSFLLYFYVTSILLFIFLLFFYSLFEIYTARYSSHQYECNQQCKVRALNTEVYNVGLTS